MPNFTLPSFLLGLEINFAQADYDITEGLTPSQPIILRFRTNQEPFTIKITPVNISTAEDMNLDSFIKTSAARAKSGKQAAFGDNNF